MSLVDKFAYQKRKRRLTTDDISTQSGIALGTLNKIFSGATKNPGFKSLNALSDVLKVPVRYLTDDCVPVCCDIGLYSAEHGLVMVRGEELSLLMDCRSLPDYDRRLVLQVISSLKRKASINAGAPTRTLVCYVPAASAPQCIHTAHTASISIQLLSVPLNAETKKADLAVQVADKALEPAYRPGAVLALQAGQARHGQLGAFLLNHKCHVRKYYQKGGVCKLVALNTDTKDIPVSSTEKLRCLGIVQGLLPCSL